MQHLRVFRRILPIAFLFLAAASLTACDVVINSMEGGIGGGRAKAEQTYAKTFALGDPGSTVEVVNVNGKIAVEAMDGTTVDVKATITVRAGTEEAARELLKEIEIRDEVNPTRVRLEAKYPRDRRRSVEIAYTIRVPRTAKVDLQNVNGTIDITGILGGVKAETTNGGVKGRQLASTVEASTTNGGVDVQMASLTPGGVMLETTNGGIELKLPAEAKATLSARCVNGGISVSDLTFEKDSESTKRRVGGKINGGGPPLRLETVNGGVRVRRM